MHAAARKGPGAPLVTIVTPTLNRAAMLESTVRSVRSQAYPNLEHIVVDGGSTDDTAAIARQAGATVVTAPAGRGGQLAAGASVGDASWILFLHADTIAVPAQLARARVKLESPESIHAMGS